jgi:hypothetical protein
MVAVETGARHHPIDPIGTAHAIWLRITEALASGRIDFIPARPYLPTTTAPSPASCAKAY